MNVPKNNCTPSPRLNPNTRQIGQRSPACQRRYPRQNRVLGFLLSLTKDNKQATKRNRYSVLSSFYNFSINTALPALANPCNSAVIKKIFKRPHAVQWQIVDKETVDEIIFRTTNTRNRLMLELMGRGGMRIVRVIGREGVSISGYRGGQARS